MALVAKRSRRTTIFIIAFIVVVVGGLGFLFIPKFFSSTNQTTTGTDISTRDLKIIDRFGEDILTDPRFQSLRTYGDPVPQVDLNQVGRTNPFAPIQ